LTSDLQQRANRANSKSSTGPKTATGRARSAQNALRHGLNVSVRWDPALALLAEAIAHRIAGPNAKPEVIELARRIAEAQVDLNRVRDGRRRLIIGLLSNPSYQPLQVLKQRLRLLKMSERIERLRGAPSAINEIEEMCHFEPLEGDEKHAAILRERVSQLAALDRYERRALSRRKFAILNFDSCARHS